MQGEGSAVRPSSPVALVVNDEADLREFLKLDPHDYHDFTLEDV